MYDLANKLSTNDLIVHAYISNNHFYRKLVQQTATEKQHLKLAFRRQKLEKRGPLILQWQRQ